MIKQYFLAAKNTWDETFVYRLNFSIWRIRTVISLLITYFLWLALLGNGSFIFGYTKAQMITYILGTAFIGNLVLSSRSATIGDEINTGDLSNYLIKPMNYFTYWFFRDLGDKAMNMSFALIEFFLIFILLKPDFYLQPNIIYVVLFVIALLISITILFFLNVLVSLLAFWVDEVWPLRFIFFIIIQFFAGSLFPLDILPKPLFLIFSSLPFPYLLYFPMKIYLGNENWQGILVGFLISVIWIFLLIKFTNFLWEIGLRKYSAQGR